MTPTAIGSLTAAQQKADAADVTSPTPEQQKAARDFEAIFLRQLMASLEKGGGLGGQSSGGQVFRSMMVGALADTASEGGGIGLSEVILKAMLPPSPQERPDLSLHAAAPMASSSPRAEGVRPVTIDPTGLEGVLGDPASTSRFGSPARVLTEARRAPMLESGVRPGAPVPEGSGR